MTMLEKALNEHYGATTEPILVYVQSVSTTSG